MDGAALDVDNLAENLRVVHVIHILDLELEQNCFYNRLLLLFQQVFDGTVELVCNAENAELFF